MGIFNWGSKRDKALSKLEEAIIEASEQRINVSYYDIKNIVENIVKDIVRQKMDFEFVEKTAEEIVNSFDYKKEIDEHFKKKFTSILFDNSVEVERRDLIASRRY